MASVYILYSESLRKFYIGSCLDLPARIEQHISNFFANSFTSKANDWAIFFLIQNLSFQQARAIEQHIKKMKSKTYIKNLKRYPEMVDKLMNRYSINEGR
jgi:putative endonuclease